ncbi:MAG: molybdopterin converting factor subunit 1 [Methanobacteriota archaeon]
MRVRVRLFATYREIVGRPELAWPIRAGDTVGTVVDGLVAEHPRLRAFRGTMLLAVNEEFARSDVVLADGDEVAIMPPVSGGRP